MFLLTKYSWPGNVEELNNVVERAVTICQTAEIGPDDLPSQLQQEGQVARIVSKSAVRDKTLREVEAQYIQLIMEKCHGNKYQAAEILGIDRKTLYAKLAEIGHERTS